MVLLYLAMFGIFNVGVYATAIVCLACLTVVPFETSSWPRWSPKPTGSGSIRYGEGPLTSPLVDLTINNY